MLKSPLYSELLYIYIVNYSKYTWALTDENLYQGSAAPRLRRVGCQKVAPKGQPLRAWQEQPALNGDPLRPRACQEGHADRAKAWVLARQLQIPSRRRRT
jgi:hypothetical protein